MFDSRTNIGEFFQRPNEPATADISPVLVTNDCVGVEVELERARWLDQLLESSQYWAIKEDGSLRNSGSEYIFRRPMNGVDTVAALEQMQTALDSLTAGRRPIPSVRSSIHVHVDVRDLNKTEFLRMLMLYTIFELPIFKAYANSRITSHFCLPYTSCIDLFPVASAAYKSLSEFESFIEHPDRGRYCALNLRAIPRFGSIEFRHLGGTLDTALILEWINVCLSFKRACHRDINFQTEFFFASKHGFEHTLAQYFPTSVADRVMAWYATNDGAVQFHRDMVEGIIFTQSMSQPDNRF